MLKNMGKIVVGVLMIVISIVFLGAIINSNNKSDGDTTSDTSLQEAQTKCILMEEADLVNYSGKPFGNSTRKEAEEFCLYQWDQSKNPDNTKEKFKEIVNIDWESRKTEVLEGYTLEQYFNETFK